LDLEYYNNKIINGLWIGNTLSKIELLTLSSFINNGHDFYLWVYEDLVTKIPSEVILKDANSIIPKERIFRYKYKNQFGHGKGSLGGFSDIFRYQLLYRHGGWWVDMDVCCLKPFDFENPYVFRTHHNLAMVGNIMKCPKGSELMLNCYNESILEVTEENTDWHKPIEILNKHIKNLNLTNYIIEISNQDSWDYVRKLITKNKPLPSNWYAIHWVNEMWRSMGLNKNFFYKKSTLGQLYFKHKIIGTENSPRERFIFFFKSLSLSNIPQLYRFIINFIKYRFYFGVIVRIYYGIILKFYHKVIVHMYFKLFCNRYIKKAYKFFGFIK